MYTRNWKQHILIIFFFISTAIAQGQNEGKAISGNVEYIFFQNLGRPVESSWNLVFEENRSLFVNSSDISYLDKNEPSGSKTFRLQVKQDLTPHIIIDFKKDSIFSQGLVFKDPFYVKDKIYNPKWEIHQERKNISGFNSQKATTNFRGRIYEVWFTPEIPIKFGPWKLNGLPGLILVATDTKSQIEFRATKIDLSMESKTNLDSRISELPKLGKVVDLKTYVEKKDLEGEQISKYISSKVSRGNNTSSNFETAGRESSIEISYEWEEKK